MSEEQKTKYYSQKLWNVQDTQISDNHFTLGTYFSKDAYGIGPTRLNLSIWNIKSGNRENVYLFHQDVFLLW